MNKDRPPITEKVKFWEEQDQINKALIPRFFEMHEIVKGLKKRESELIKKNISLGERVSTLEKRISSLNYPSVDSSNNKPLIISITSLLIAVLSLLIVIL